MNTTQWRTQPSARHIQTRITWRWTANGDGTATCEIRTLARLTPHHGNITCVYDGPARSEGRFQAWDAACECGWRDEDLTTWAYAYWALHRHQTEETA